MMNDKAGRAAFHAKHYKAGGGDAAGLLREAMRAVDEDYLAYYADKNKNVIISDTHKNVHLVNTGTGFREAKSISEVLDYAQSREEQVTRKISEKQLVLSTFVIFLPKTLCEEVPGVYAVEDSGEKRLRRVERDYDESQRYFADVIRYMGDHVIPGGMAAIHGAQIHYDESTPQIHIMADVFAGEPDNLRSHFSQAFGLHRDVRYPDGDPKAGRQMDRREKMRRYQAGFREYMIQRGWPVEAEVGPSRTMSPGEYAKADDARIRAEADAAAIREDAEAITLGAKHYAKSIKDTAEADAAAIREQAQAEAQQLLQAEQRQLLAIQAAHAQAQLDLEAAEKAAAEAEERKEQVSVELTERMRRAKAAMDSAKQQHAKLSAEITEKQQELVDELSSEARAAVVEKVSSEAVSDLPQLDADFLRDFKATEQGAAYFAQYVEMRAAEEVPPTRVTHALEDEHRARQNRVQQDVQDFEL